MLRPSEKERCVAEGVGWAWMGKERSRRLAACSSQPEYRQNLPRVVHSRTNTQLVKMDQASKTSRFQKET
jgi:hypothetical protein